jgi:hypothetical protein
LTGDVAMITEGIIFRTCKELDIEIIEIERKDKQNTQERISPSKRMVRRTYVGARLFPRVCWEWMGCGE